MPMGPCSTCWVSEAGNGSGSEVGVYLTLAGIVISIPGHDGWHALVENITLIITPNMKMATTSLHVVMA